MLAEALDKFKQEKMLAVKRCIVADWSHSLSENDQAAFEQALNDYGISNRQLLKVLISSGASFSLEALRKHRTEECPCR